VADELAEYMAVGEALLFSAPAVEPPPRLLESLMAAAAPVKREDTLRRQRDPRSRLISPRQRGLGTALAALAVVILLVANVYWVVQVGRYENTSRCTCNCASRGAAHADGRARLEQLGRLAPTEAEAPSYAVLVWTRGIEDELVGGFVECQEPAHAVAGQGVPTVVRSGRQAGERRAVPGR
jgi:hypothetical protein